MQYTDYNKAATMHRPADTANIPQQQKLKEAQSQFPMPTAAPWNLDSMPWASTATGSSVMQFSGAPVQRRSQIHQKRKLQLTTEFGDIEPPKQFISEEKITAHFNGLHISSDYIQNSNLSTVFASTMADDDTPSTSGKCFTNLTYQDYEVTAKELGEKLKKASRITICDEIKKLHEEQKKVTFLPEALLNRIEKPCTALVLWQPPPILELLQQKDVHGLNNTNNLDEDCADVVEVDDAFFPEPYAEIDDYIDNNNTCCVDYNNLKTDGMDEDL